MRLDKMHNRELNNFHSSPSTYNYNYQVKEDKMGREYGTHGKEEECIHGFGGKSNRKETTRKT
jgi:hypothetical protein